MNDNIKFIPIEFVWNGWRLYFNFHFNEWTLSNYLLNKTFKTRNILSDQEDLVIGWATYKIQECLCDGD